MILHGIPEKEGNLEFLKQLLNDKTLKTYGVSYSNSFFSQRYLCRQHLLNKVEFTEDSVKMTVATRVEQVGFLELENTLDVLVKHEAGDIPGLIPEGLLDPEDEIPQEFLPESVSVTQFLTSVDLLLIMKDPIIKYQVFNIAGSKFTLVNIHHQLGEDLEQTVTILLGKAGKLYFLSHLHNKELNDKDVKILMDLIMDENITGRAIRGISVHLQNGVQTSVFPFDRLISSYTAVNGDYVFGDGSGYVTIPRDQLSSFYVECNADEKGAYTIYFENPDTDYTINITLE